MANDVSYFKVNDDPTQYAFNDADLSAALEAEIARAQAAESNNADAITTEQERAEAAEEANTSAIAALNSNLTDLSSRYQYSTANGYDYFWAAVSAAGLGYINVAKTDGTKYQMVMRAADDIPTFQYYDGTSWSSVSAATWRSKLSVPALSEIYYASGDTFSFSASTAVAGLVTSGVTNLYLTVPTPKSMSKISTVTVTAMTGGIRTTSSGYLDGVSDGQSWLNRDGVTVTASKASDNMIRVTVSKTSAFSNAQNNTPVVGSLNFSFRFT